jgi:hypothetical protein
VAFTEEPAMTEYELASLFAQISQTLNAQLSNYLTVVSLYLGAGYLVAHRLTLPSAITFTGIFLVMNLGLITVTIATVRGQMGVARQIHEFAEQGKGLQWHQGAAMPSWVPAYMPMNSAILLTVIALGAVYFFFASRRHNLKTLPPAPRNPAPAEADLQSVA